VQLSSETAGATAATQDVDYRELMEEPAGGQNHGRVTTIAPEELGRQLPLGVDEAQAHEFVKSGGWSIVDPLHDGRASGAVAHRGAIHPDEYVDDDVVRAAVESRLGFTTDEVRSVFRQGRLTPEQGELRARIDARLLALSRAGANMTELARLVGFGETADGTWPKALKNAIRRAKDAEASA
jgi:AraC-like DNA-binding protein